MARNQKNKSCEIINNIIPKNANINIIGYSKVEFNNPLLKYEIKTNKKTIENKNKRFKNLFEKKS
jgi:hypothetical protein